MAAKLILFDYIIRVSSDPVYGGGHITRCLVLAQYLTSPNKLIFVIDNHSSKLPPSIMENGYKVVTEQQYRTSAVNANACIIDGYQFTNEDELYWKNRVKTLIRIIDDRSYSGYADVLVNYNSATIDSDKENTIKFCGLNYTLVDFKTSDARNKCINARSVKHKLTLLICFGMRDNKNATLKVLFLLKKFKCQKKLRFIIVLRKEAPHYKCVKNFIPVLRNECLLLNNIKHMGSVLTQADIVIGAGGVGLLERCSALVPSLTLTTDARQESGSNLLAALGGTIYLGTIEDVTTYRLFSGLSLLSNRLWCQRKRLQMSYTLFDGSGAKRLAWRLNEIIR